MSDKTEAVLKEMPRLRRYALVLTGDRTPADDLVQDTVERAISRLHLWRSGSNMRSWLFTIMHNLHVNNVRQSIRRGTETQVSDHDAALVTKPSQGDHVLIREMSEAIDHLSVEQREVLVFVVLEGMSYREVADVLDIPIGTVMSRLARARDYLRQIMDGEEATALRRVK